MAKAEARPQRVVRQDQHVGLSGLFRLLANGERPMLDVRYELEDGRLKLHFRGPEALGIPEQTLFLALLELAQEAWYRLNTASLVDQDTESAIGLSLWKSLHRDSEGACPAVLHFGTTWSELTRRTGYKPGGTRNDELEKQLKRMCECTVWESHVHGPNDATEFQSFLVAMTYSNAHQLDVAVNVRLTEAITQNRYMPISMAERLTLNSSRARALHAFLSAWIRHGERQRIGVERLVQRLWPLKKGAKARPASTQRRKCMEVRDELEQIGALEGWSVTDIAASVVTVHRHAAGEFGGTALDRRESSSASEPVRQMTWQKPNAGMANAERPGKHGATSGAGFQRIDASALFLS